MRETLYTKHDVILIARTNVKVRKSSPARISFAALSYPCVPQSPVPSHTGAHPSSVTCRKAQFAGSAADAAARSAKVPFPEASASNVPCPV